MLAQLLREFKTELLLGTNTSLTSQLKALYTELVT